MPVTAQYAGLFFKSLFNKEVDFDSDTIKGMLVNGYTWNQDTHQYKSSVTSEVANGNGYTTGGATVTSPATAYTAGTNTLAMTGGNLSWPSSTFSATGLVLYDSTPATDATRPIIGYVDFGGTQSPSNGTLSVTWDAGGIATVTVS